MSPSHSSILLDHIVIPIHIKKDWVTRDVFVSDSISCIKNPALI